MAETYWLTEDKPDAKLWDLMNSYGRKGHTQWNEQEDYKNVLQAGLWTAIKKGEQGCIVWHAEGDSSGAGSLRGMECREGSVLYVVAQHFFLLLLEIKQQSI